MIREIRFYTDEHVAYAVARGLRRRGVDVVTSQEARMLGASDEEQLALAASQGRVIITQDDDFLRLHARRINHSGIVYASHQMSIGDIVRGLMILWRVLSVSEMQNHVEFL